MDFAEFDWDRGNLPKCQKHGVSIDEIESLFAGTVLIGPDPAHSASEERLRGYGRTAAGRRVMVAFTFRNTGGKTRSRPSSTRFMLKKEADYYEKTIPDVAH